MVMGLETRQELRSFCDISAMLYITKDVDSSSLISWRRICLFIPWRQIKASLLFEPVFHQSYLVLLCESKAQPQTKARVWVELTFERREIDGALAWGMYCAAAPALDYRPLLLFLYRPEHCRGVFFSELLASVARPSAFCRASHDLSWSGKSANWRNQAEKHLHNHGFCKHEHTVLTRRRTQLRLCIHAY